MNRLSPIIIFIVFLNLYFGFHGFLLFRALKWKIGLQSSAFFLRIPNWLYWVVFLLIALLYAGIFHVSGYRSLFRLANAYWGIIVFLPLLATLDVVYFFRFALRFVIRHFNGADSLILHSPFWGQAFTFVSHLIIVALVAGIAVFGSLSARYSVITEYRIKTEKAIPGGRLDIILVSDIHLGALVDIKKLKSLVSKINSAQGDIVLIAGDILDRDLGPNEWEGLVRELSRLQAKFGVWAVPGNHDYYGGQLRQLKEKLAVCGITLLEDEVCQTDEFYVAGRKDRTAERNGEGRKTVSDLLAGIDKNRLILLLDHQPYNLGDAESAGVDLQVSGHTHRGQVWPGSIVTGRMYENDYGLLYKGKTAFIVSSGYGTWGPSFRIGTKSEIVRIVLEN